MGLWNLLFGSDEKTPEQEQAAEISKKFDLFKYDGVKAMKMGQVDYAVRCFTEALAIQEDGECMDYLAQCYMRAGQLDEAMATLNRLAELVPDNIGVYLQMARLAFMQEDYEAMAATCAKAMEIEPESATAHLLNGQAQVGQGKMIEAVAMFTKAISLNEALGDAYLHRGSLLLKMGDVQSADADADYLLSVVPDNEEVLMLKARIEHAKGKAAEAIAIYNKVIDVNPFNADAYKERGKVKFELGDTIGAKEDVEKLLELMPDALSNVSGDYSADGVEHKVKQAYSNLNPFGI